MYTEQKIRNKVFVNSLQTCEYISGYTNSQSIIKVRCLIHGIEFETKYENIKRDNRKHHICPMCKKEDLKKASTKIECECAYCHKIFFREPSKLNNSKSGLVFCCREHKDLAQQIDSGNQFDNIRPFHYNSGENYRQRAFRKYKPKCSVCRWNEDTDVLEVHHIDENRQNNDLSNLIILCPICHKKLTTHKYILVDRNRIQKI